MNCNGGSARRFDLKLLIAPIIRFAAMRHSNGHSFTIVQQPLPPAHPAHHSIPGVMSKSRASTLSPPPSPTLSLSLSLSLSLALPLSFPAFSFFFFFPFSKNISNITTRFCGVPIYESPRETLRFLPAARFNSKSSTAIIEALTVVRDIFSNLYNSRIRVAATATARNGGPLLNNIYAATAILHPASSESGNISGIVSIVSGFGTGPSSPSITEITPISKQWCVGIHTHTHTHTQRVAVFPLLRRAI